MVCEKFLRQKQNFKAFQEAIFRKPFFFGYRKENLPAKGREKSAKKRKRQRMIFFSLVFFRVFSREQFLKKPKKFKACKHRDAQ
jgi:hypothetical protein